MYYFAYFLCTRTCIPESIVVGFDPNRNLLVPKITIVIMVIALAIGKGCHLYQMDVKNEFLKVELKEEVYMMQPLSYNQANMYMWFAY